MKTVQMRSGLFHPPREELPGSAVSLLLRGHHPGNPHLRGGNNGASVVTVLLEKSSTMNLHPKKTPPPSRLARRSPLHAGKRKVERGKQKDSLSERTLMKETMETSGMTWMRKMSSPLSHVSDLRGSPGRSWTELRITHHSNCFSCSFPQR